ncbi:MAG TPA: hypothetical protein VFL93_10090 [Longimicrobiaceae bacterium]|nr:hypothetical protein [Longimicrobiaceae bacterium]
MKSRAWWGWGGLVLIGLIVGLFVWLNAGERAVLDFGVFVLYRVPLPAIVLLSVLIGMVAMFLAGLRHDLEVRRVLRERGLIEPPAPPRPPAPPPDAYP